VVNGDAKGVPRTQAVKTRVDLTGSLMLAGQHRKKSAAIRHSARAFEGKAAPTFTPHPPKSRPAFDHVLGQSRSQEKVMIREEKHPAPSDHFTRPRGECGKRPWAADATAWGAVRSHQLLHDSKSGKGGEAAASLPCTKNIKPPCHTHVSFLETKTLRSLLTVGDKERE